MHAPCTNSLRPSEAVLLPWLEAPLLRVNSPGNMTSHAHLGHNSHIVKRESEREREGEKEEMYSMDPPKHEDAGRDDHLPKLLCTV